MYEHLFCGLPFGLHAPCALEQNACLLLLAGVSMEVCQVWLVYSFAQVFLLIFCLVVQLIIERRILKYPPLLLLNFLFGPPILSAFALCILEVPSVAYFCSYHIFSIALPFYPYKIPFYHYIFLSEMTIFALKCILSVSVATPALFYYSLCVICFSNHLLSIYFCL